MSNKVSFFKMVQITGFCLLYFLVLSNVGYAQLNPDAGYIPSYTVGATVSATSTHSSTDPNNVVDGDPETFWLSDGCLPANYITRPDLNILLGGCIDGTYSSSGVHGTGDLCDITDGSLNTGPWLLVQDGSVWFEIELENPSKLNLIGARIYLSSSSAAIITVSAFTTTGTEIEVGTFSIAADGFPLLLKNLDVPTEEEVQRIRVSSNQQFQLMELAALSGPLYDAITIDFGETKETSWIEKLNKSAMEVTAIILETSTDNENWTFLADLDPSVKSWIKIRLEVPVYARYLRFKHELKNINYVKAYLYEVRAYDEYGPYAPPPAPQINTNTISELLGVNSQRHWGTSTFSDLLSENECPLLFGRFSAHGRCYHNWRQDLANWGSSDPLANNPPNYIDGWSTGDIWSREYAGWLSSGLEVEATIQFLNSRDLGGNISGTTLLVEEFNGYNVVDEAYKFGQKYAGYFGSTYKNVVKVMEVGNEPWNYPADFYRDILYGMAKGIKETDPNMVVLPCALNAHEPEQAGADGGRYIGARLSDREVPYIDALNIHVYSWMYDANGTRIGINPEHPESELNTVRNMIRFRDNNPTLMGKPIYVTEWGWDSDGCNQPCDHNECVSEYAQAVYAVRSTLLFSRLGLDRLTWYHYTNDLWFYLNPQNPSSIWMRSGVTCSVEGMLNLPLKKSFIAFEAMVNTIGDRHFVQAIREDNEAYVYLLGDLDGTPTHLVAWRPIDVDREANISTMVNVSVEGFPGDAWTLEGIFSTGEPTISPTVESGLWSFEVNGTPLVVSILPGPGSVAGNVTDELGPVQNVLIDLYDTDNILFGSSYTSTDGSFQFPEVDPGNYTVEIIVPLGYLAVTASQVEIFVLPGQETDVDFLLDRKDIIVEARSSGYWKHQVKSLISGKGNAQKTEEALLDYLSDIKTFWNYFDLLDESLLGLQSVLDLPKKPSMKQKTEKELMSLLLNVASEKMATFTEVSNDDDVGEAIDYIIYVLENAGSTNEEHEQVKDLAEMLNHGDIPIDPAAIPETLPKRQPFQQISKTVPDEYGLPQNYPNPFNTSCTIEWRLPETAIIALDIYDINGRLIENLYEGNTGPGYYRVSWDARNYSSGFYFLKFKTKKFNKTIKLTLIK